MSGKRSRGRRRKNTKTSTKQLRAFWGEDDRLPELPSSAKITRDSTAVVRSLGRMPLAGHETIAEHYLEAVLDRTVMLGSALAAAGGLIEADELTDR